MLYCVYKEKIMVMRMNNLKTEIINLFENDDMKSCIDSDYNSLMLSVKADIIKGARIDIRKKLELLKLLYDNASTENDFEIDMLKSDINEFTRATEHFGGIFGDVYILGEYGFVEDIKDEKLYGYSPYTCFYKALRHIKSDWEDEADPSDEGISPTYWYTIEKYSPDNNGEMHGQIRWYVSADGTVTGFDGIGRAVDINIPLPFCEGDIVIMDSSPSFPPRVGVVLETDSNQNECCKPQILYRNRFGKFNSNALKHATVFRDYYGFPIFSSLYRLKKFDGALTGDEKIFSAVSEKLKKCQSSSRPTLGNILWELIYETDRTGTGVTAETLKELLERGEKEWHSKEYSG